MQGRRLTCCEPCRHVRWDWISIVQQAGAVCGARVRGGLDGAWRADERQPRPAVQLQGVNSGAGAAGGVLMSLNDMPLINGMPATPVTTFKASSTTAHEAAELDVAEAVALTELCAAACGASSPVQAPRMRAAVHTSLRSALEAAASAQAAAAAAAATANASCAAAELPRTSLSIALAVTAARQAVAANLHATELRLTAATAAGAAACAPRDAALDIALRTLDSRQQPSCASFRVKK